MGNLVGLTARMGSNPIPSVKLFNCIFSELVFGLKHHAIKVVEFAKTSKGMAAIAILAGLIALFLFMQSPASAQAQGNASFEKNSTEVTIMSQVAAKKGDSVAVDYLGTLDDGTVFDTSIEAEAKKANLPPRPLYEPLSFTVGAGQMIKGFDEGVVGMNEGEEKTIKLAPKDAYGESLPGNIMILPNAQFEQMLGQKAEVGMSIYTQQGLQGKVAKITANETTVDFNHPLAGKALTFKIIMKKIGA